LPALWLAAEQHGSAKLSGEYAGHQPATGAGQTRCYSFHACLYLEGERKRFLISAGIRDVIVC
jgi:hypothetical protein